MRECLPMIVQAQFKDFIASAECLTIATDDSPSSDDSQNYTSLGLIDETGKYMCIGFLKNDQKDAKGIAEAMTKTIQASALFEEIFKKLNNDASVISDCSRAQRLANIIFLEQAAEKFGRAGNQSKHFNHKCLMHTGMSVYSERQLKAICF